MPNNKRKMSFVFPEEFALKLEELSKILGIASKTSTLNFIVGEFYKLKILDSSKIERKTNLKIIDKPKFDFGENIFFHPDLFYADRKTGVGCVLVDMDFIDYRINKSYTLQNTTQFQKDIFLTRNHNDYPTVFNIAKKFPEELEEIKIIYPDGIYDDTLGRNIGWKELEL
jgi:hypothetical protein